MGHRNSDVDHEQRIGHANRALRNLSRTIVTLGLPAALLAACGRSSDRAMQPEPVAATLARPPALTAPTFSAHGKDRDNDTDHNDDDGKILDYGHPASRRDFRLSADLVRRYFAAAAGEQGARACSLLAPFVAEAVPEYSGRSSGPHGDSCPVALKKLFEHHHSELAMKNATLEVVGVRVEGRRGLVVLAFPTISEVREIVERRVGNGWRLIDLLDELLE
jgi:hypothetical protein